MDVIKLGKEAGLNMPDRRNDLWMPQFERFAELVRVDLMKQVLDICEAEYQKYDELEWPDETCAMIHLMRKLEKLK